MSDQAQSICTICGRPAITIAHDHRETSPGKWEEEGPPKPLCAEHARPQRLTFANGNTFEAYKKIS